MLPKACRDPGLQFSQLLTIEWKPMARKTNYGFERREREKARAAKKAERQRQKQEKSNERRDDGSEAEQTPESTEDRPAES